jgi:hypothetical protein
LLPLFNFVWGEAERIDLASKRVTVTHGYDCHAHDLPYDHLVLPLGSVTNFFKLRGVHLHDPRPPRTHGRRRCRSGKTMHRADRGLVRIGNGF